MKNRFVNLAFFAIIITYASCNSTDTTILGEWRIHDINIDTANTKGSLAVVALAVGHSLPEKVIIGKEEISVEYGDKTAEVFNYRIMSDSLIIMKDGNITPFLYHFDKTKRLVLTSNDLQLYLQK
ncbi:MAG TPA: hypothetical protein VLC98_05735 [Phnomibacter sp.]|nr:hypothetical protein [Phnomibacter sp.]